MTKVLRLGTRGSPLALAQARELRRRLAAAEGALAADGAVEIVPITTSGDRQQSGPLTDLGGKGLFTREIEQALVEGAIDLAVHSLKDAPTWRIEGLCIDAVLEREDPRDALLSDKADSIEGLPEGAVVGTASLRRKAILLYRRPDLEVVTLRGNVETRIRKLAQGDVDATLLAIAGLRRLGRAEAARAVLSVDEMLPAVCQGVIGLECRRDDTRVRDLLARIDHRPTAIRVAAERALLAALDGSCRTPIAALAELDGNDLTLRAAVVRPDGGVLIETTRRGAHADAASLGEDAAAELKGRAGPGFFDEAP